MPEIKIMPSLLAADVGRLEDEIRRSEQAGCDGMHIDVMDGHFVPNISLGPNIVEMAKRVCNLHLSVHLMITRPDSYADRFIDAGADTLLIHVEADCDVGDVLRTIKSRGIRPGITLNPDTPAEAVFPYLDQSDEVMCMTVHPGFGGQAFIKEVLPKIETLRAKAPEMDISVDGGLDRETAELSAQHGANIILAGTSLFKAADMKEEVAYIRSTVESVFNRSKV